MCVANRCFREMFGFCFAISAPLSCPGKKGGKEPAQGALRADAPPWESPAALPEAQGKISDFIVEEAGCCHCEEAQPTWQSPPHLAQYPECFGFWAYGSREMERYGHNQDA